MDETLFDPGSATATRVVGAVDEVAPSWPPDDGVTASFVVLVTASRYADDAHRSVIARGLLRAVAWLPMDVGDKRIVLRHGAAKGGDTIAAELAASYRWTLDPWPADWATCTDECPTSKRHRMNRAGWTYCPAAGPRRNKAMVDAPIRPAVVVGFPDIAADPARSGTWHCLHYAISRGLHVASVDGLTVVRRG